MAEDIDVGQFAEALNDKADKITVDQQLATKADNTSVVHNTGNETIAGVKTFSSAPILNSATASTVPVLSSTKQIVSSAVTATELGYLDGVTSAIQTQLNGKQATISGAATTITGSNLTASRAVISNSSGKVAVSDTTSTELGYVHGVTSAIQTQLNAKAPLASPAFTGTPTAPTAGSSTNNTQVATTAFVTTKVNSLTRLTASQKPTSSNNYTWYRKYSDKWVEQGGHCSQSANGTVTLNLPVAMSDTNYTAVANPITTYTTTSGSYGMNPNSKTTTAITVYYSTNLATGGIDWFVCGYAAS